MQVGYGTIALALLACTAASAASPASPDHPNDYQVIMWVLGGVPGDGETFFRRMNDLNVTAMQISPGDSPQGALDHGLGFYVENVHRIGFLHEANKVYKADWEGYTKTRDKQYLIRKPCLHDPAYLAEAKADIQSKIRLHAHQKPILYDLGDECSITSFASPMDYCFSEHTLAAFREWLQEQYGDLKSLNAEWQTEFAAWDEVVPLTTYEMKEQEKARSENYSPWADHRTFMDITYAESWRLFREWVREIDPTTPVGLEGLQMAAAFGGYDLYRLSGAVDWVEPYDIAGSHAIFRSFLPPGSPVFATVFEHDAKPLSRRLWHLLLNGDRGAIIWCSSDWFDYKSPDLTPQPWVAGMTDLFAELRGPAAGAMMNAKRDRAPIALHYSQPSIQASWMIDSRVDGDTWVRRFSSYESSHSTVALVRNSWMKLIEDLGLQYDFVSSQQIVDGTLAERGYRVLVLPQSLAVGDEEASRIKAFVKAGGTVIADNLTGMFDEHCKRRTAGVLDGLFGVNRPVPGMVALPGTSEGPGFRLDGRHVPLGPAEINLRLLVGRPGAYTAPASIEKPAAGVPDRTPVLIARSVGKGRTHYLNLSLIDYAKQRLMGEGGDLRGIVGDILTDSGVAPAVEVTTADGGAPVGCEVITYQGDGCRYVAIMRNPEYDVSDLGEIGYTDNSRFEQPERLTVELPEPAQVRDLLSGRDLGTTDRAEVILGPWKPILLELH